MASSQELFEDGEVPWYDDPLFNDPRNDDSWVASLVTINYHEDFSETGKVRQLPLFQVTGDKVFPFLQLPAEVRNHIYEEVFGRTPEGMSIIYEESATLRAFTRRYLGLFSTCRQVYNEAAGVLYRNRFEIGGCRKEDIPSHAFMPIAHRIRHLTLSAFPEAGASLDDAVKYGEDFVMARWNFAPLLPLLQKFTSLENLYVEFSTDIYLPQAATDYCLMLLRGIFISVIENVRPGVDINIGEPHWSRRSEDGDALRESFRKSIERYMALQGTAIEEIA